MFHRLFRATRHALGTLLSAARLSTADRARHISQQRLKWSLALPKMRCTDDGHRKTHCCRDPTSFSSRPGHCCRMNDSLPHQTFACVSSLSLSLPCRFTNHVLLLSQLLSSREPWGFCHPLHLPVSSAVLCRTASAHLHTAPSHNLICIGPRPPQPRAATFKRLYRKRAGAPCSCTLSS
jgi:hypothetical protein